MPMHKRANLGLGYLPQEPSIFRKLSVENNIMAVLELNKTLPAKLRKHRLEELYQSLMLNMFVISKVLLFQEVSVGGLKLPDHLQWTQNLFY